jgi:trigger factor
MEVSVQNSDGLYRRLKVAVPEERVEGEVNSRLQTMARNASVPGFRPGRVPIKVVMQRFGRKVREEVVGDIVRSSFQDALVRENLRPASSPTIDAIQSDPGTGIAYEAVFEVYPEVSIPPLTELDVVRPVAQVLDTDVDAMITTLRKQRRVWRSVDRDARHGDRAIIDFSGRCEGRPVENGEGHRMPVEIGLGKWFQDSKMGS